MKHCDGFHHLPFRDNDVGNDEDIASFSSTPGRCLLLGLPAELLDLICASLHRISDIAHVCLTSRKLHDAAMPHLYNFVEIVVDDWNPDHLKAFLNRGHAGHRHIRGLDVNSKDLLTEHKALRAAKDLLSVLPRDRLHMFRCPLESGMDNDIMILLTAYQRNLEFLSIGPLHPCAFANVLKPYLPWPMFLETLVVPWRLMSRQDTDFCQQVIEQSPQSLRALTVRAHCYGDGTGFRQQEFDTTRLPLDLFKHVDSFEGERKTEIHELNLQNQNLSGCKTTWIKYVDFCKLKTLQVWNCDGLDELLAEMENISREHNMQLHGLVLSLEEGFTTPVRVENFLSMTARLSYLHAAYVADTTAVGFPGFDIKCLRPHAATLKDLLLGIGSNGEFWHLHVPSIADIEWLTTTCTKLRQLAIPLPGITLKNAFSGQWGDCGTALLRLASLPRLKILRILTWPHVAADPLVDTMASINRRFSPGREKYLQSLHTIADSIARLFHQIRDEHADRLSVIMFGHTEAEQWVKDESGTGRMFFDLPITYKVRRVMTEFGLRTIVERIEPQEMKYEEPIAYVVDEDTDQGLSLEAYLSKKL